jgi:16S rRNA (uracil1498-N3)-methyltransferase
MKPVQEVLETPFEGICSIAHCDNADNRKYLHEIYKKNNPITILIGPEGDFSSNEITLAKKHNWTTISLGESRLRTETAGIAAVHTIHQLQLLNF